MFWKSKWECGVYASIFLMAAFIFMIQNSASIYKPVTQLCLFIGSFNLILFLFKTIRKNPSIADTNLKSNSIFYKSKWQNGLYALLFLIVGVILFLKKEATLDSLVIQLALLFGSVEMLIFIVKILKLNKFKQMD
ncbi:MAG TPA: hypothetical protein ENH91_01055 [Leeuwenhoekiella sp.]|nr:hypothetical protein [Leeuwenhoekiella sp.]